METCYGSGWEIETLVKRGDTAGEIGWILMFEMTVL